MTDSKLKNNDPFIENHFVLFSTEACHLCEDALNILNDLHRQMLELAQENDYEINRQSIFTIEVVDVVNDSFLLETYGPRIPMLIFPTDANELAWPFDIQSAYEFILPKLSFSS